MDSSHKVIIVMLATCIVLLIVIAWKVYSPAAKEKFAAGPAEAGKKVSFAPQGELILFFMNGCGHCDAMMPAWDSVKPGIEGKGVQVYEIEANDVPSLETQDIKGFPTVRYYPRGFSKEPKNYAQLKGPRDAASLVAFVDEVSQK